MAKKKKYTTGRTALSTIGSVAVALIFCSMVVFSLGTIAQNTIWNLIVQCLSLAIFIPLIYSPSWYCGDHDANSVSFGRMKEDLNKGLQIGLIAMIPFALTPVILILSKLSITPDLGFVYRILNVHLLYAVNALLPPDTALQDVSWGEIFIVWVYHILIPITTAVAYRLGYKHISLSERLIFKNLPKNKSNPRR